LILNIIEVSYLYHTDKRISTRKIFCKQNQARDILKKSIIEVLHPMNIVYYFLK